MAYSKILKADRDVIVAKYVRALEKGDEDPKAAKDRIVKEIDAKAPDRYSVRQLKAVASQVTIQIREKVLQPIGLSDTDINPDFLPYARSVVQGLDPADRETIDWCATNLNISPATVVKISTITAERVHAALNLEVSAPTDDASENKENADIKDDDARDDDQDDEEKERNSRGDHVEYRKQPWSTAITGFVTRTFDEGRIRNAKMACMPNKRGTGVDRYLAMGGRPENMFCVEGGDAEARLEFAESMRARGIEPHLGRLDAMLKGSDAFDLVEIDLLGSYSREAIRAAKNVRLRPNARCAVILNWGEGRETQRGQDVMRSNWYILYNSMHIKDLKDIHLFGEEEKKSVSLDDARNAFGIMLLKNLGVERQENWLYPELFNEIPLEEDTKQKKSSEITNRLARMRRFMDMHIGPELLKVFGKYRSAFPPEFIVGSLINNVERSMIGTSVVESLENYEYTSISGRGGKRYFSDFAVVQTPLKEYEQARAPVKFFLQTIKAMAASENNGDKNLGQFTIRDRGTNKEFPAGSELTRAAVLQYHHPLNHNPVEPLTCKRLIDALKLLNVVHREDLSYKIFSEKHPIVRSVIPMSEEEA